RRRRSWCASFWRRSRRATKPPSSASRWRRKRSPSNCRESCAIRPRPCGAPAERMAVYTEVADEELEAFVAEYRIGRVLACKGIAEGVENSNFLLQTDAGVYILTLYEKRVRPEDLPFFLALMEHLATRGIPCPTPVHGIDGKALR